MSQTYFALLTDRGEAKLANAQALGTQVQYSHMAVGDGNGNLPVPDRLQPALVREQYRAGLNELKVDPLNASQIIAELVIPENIGGWWIREMGIYDADGDLVAVANCPPSYKPLLAEGSGRTQVLRMVLIVASTAAVQLKIDPSVVLATREFVTTTVAAELAKLDAKASVKAATTANLAALSGLLTVDGVVLVAGDRVLVKDQAAGATNGIYVAAVGAWARAVDADSVIEVTPGMLVTVEQGANNGDSIWQLATDAPITIGTTVLVFEIAAGPSGVSAGTYRSVTVDKRGRVTGGTNPTTLAGHGITDAATSAELESKRTKRVARLSSAAVQTLSGASVGPTAFTPLNHSFNADGGLYLIIAKINLNTSTAGAGGSNYIGAKLLDGAAVLDATAQNIMIEQNYGTSLILIWSGTLTGTKSLSVAFEKSSTVGSVTVNGDRDNTTNNDSGQLSCLEIFRIGDAA